MIRRRLAAFPAVLAFGAVLIASTVTSSAASWTDAEYDLADVSALDCAAGVSGTSTGSGTLLGGTLLGLDLGAVAEVRGITVSDTGAGAAADPASSTEVPGSDGDAFQNPLVVSAAFGAIGLDLGDVLRVPVSTQLGAYGQYARASGDASSAGAAGTITQGGGVDFDAVSAPPEERPRFGTLELGTVLEQALGSGLASLVSGDLTDLRLDLGAVASAVSLDGCAAVWGASIADAVTRDYAIAGLDLEADSPLTMQVTGAVTSTLSSLTTALTALSGNQALLADLASGILGPSGLGPLLATLGLGTPTVALTVTPDFSAVIGLLDDTISDDSGIVAIDLGTGIIRVDLASLLGTAYGQEHLNGLPPNSELLIDDEALNALLLAVGDAVDDWIADVQQAITGALAAVRVQLRLSVPLTLLGNTLGVLTVQTDASLAALAAGTAVVSTGFAQTPGLCTIVLVGPTLCSAVTTLLTGLTPAVLTALGPVIAATLDTAIDGAVGSLLTSLGSTLAGVAARVVTLLDDTLGGLFGEGGVVGLLADAQNDPDPLAIGAGPAPAAWAALPGPVAGYPSSTGRYDVAALRLTVIGAVRAVELELARSSVGANLVAG
jgi:hypothetical protein